MIRFAFIILIFSVIGGCCHGTKPERAIISGTEAIILSNRYTSLAIVPAASGAVAEWRYLDQPLMAPLQFTAQEDDLLPPVYSVNATGARIFFWGMQNLGAVDMEVMAADDCSVELFSRFYQAQPLSLRRKISIEPDSTIVNIDLEITNIGEQPQKIALWENMIAQLHPQIQDEVIIPVRGKTVQVARQRVRGFSTDTIFIRDPASGNQTEFLAPARNWIARRNAHRDLTVAVRIPEEQLIPDGFFYTWKDSRSIIHTMEIVFSPMTPAVGETVKRHLEYLVFPGLRDLKDICGDIGIDAKIEDEILYLTLSSARNQGGNELKLSLRNSKGDTIALPSRHTAEFRVGRAQHFSFRLPPVPDGGYQITGTCGNNSFNMLSLIITGKKALKHR